MQTMTAANANRHFSSLLRDARAGQTIQITSRGKPVAVVEPIAAYDANATKNNAGNAVRDALFARLQAQRSASAHNTAQSTTQNTERSWTRGELYD